MLKHRWSVTTEIRAPGGITGSASTVYLVNHNADNVGHISLSIERRRDGSGRGTVSAAGQFNRGSFIIRRAPKRRCVRVSTSSHSGLRGCRCADREDASLRAARIAIMHTWLTTQDEGWFRLGFDHLQVPFTYISTQDVSRDQTSKQSTT